MKNTLILTTVEIFCVKVVTYIQTVIQTEKLHSGKYMFIRAEQKLCRDR